MIKNEYDPAQDYYLTMGLDHDASADEVKKSYHKLSRGCHPDVNGGDKNAEGWFKLLNEANDVLSVDDRRRRYDHDHAVLLAHGPAHRMYKYGYQGGTIDESRRIMKAMIAGEFYSFTEVARPAGNRNLPVKCK